MAQTTTIQISATPPRPRERKIEHRCQPPAPDEQHAIVEPVRNDPAGTLRTIVGGRRRCSRFRPIGRTVELDGNQPEDANDPELQAEHSRNRRESIKAYALGERPPLSRLRCSRPSQVLRAVFA